MKKNLRDYSLTELQEIVKESGEAGYRAKQIFEWLHKQSVDSFEQMKNIPAKLIDAIAGNYYVSLPTIKKKQVSKIDGTTKLLLKLIDGELIECVILPDKDRVSLCISSQVGCKCGCSFCATAALGFKRDLTAGEIIGQFIVAEKEAGKKLDSVVFMGMGEPLMNFKNVKKGIEILSSRSGRFFSQSRITVSTVGIVPVIREFADSGLKCGLAISIISADDRTRTSLIPYNKKYPLADIIKEAKHYNSKTGRDVTFEYILFDGINDSQDDALLLLKVLKGLDYKVNLIPYNKVTGKKYVTDPREKAEKFQKILIKAGKKAFLRKEKGADIDAACGQLAGRLHPAN